MTEEIGELQRQEQNGLWEDYDRKCLAEWNAKQKLLDLADQAKQEERNRIQKVLKNKIILNY